MILEEHITNMRSLGDMLVPYNYPKGPRSNENSVSLFKTRILSVDGYDVIVYYSKSETVNAYLEVFKIQGKQIPFLPFNLVVKLAKKFLGSDDLIYRDYFSGRKMYIWTRQYHKDNSVIIPENVSEKSYEGWSYKEIYRFKGEKGMSFDKN